MKKKSSMCKGPVEGRASTGRHIQGWPLEALQRGSWSGEIGRAQAERPQSQSTLWLPVSV